MTDISVSQLVNQIDQSNFTLYAEWQNTYFKIILLRSCKVPLSGEMCIENAKYYLQHLEESFDMYLEKTKRAFSGENMEVQFFLKDDTFTWKQHNFIIRGEITVHPFSNILTISDILKQILERYEGYQKCIVVLEKKNKYLDETNAKLATDKEITIRMKESMEKDLYRKFILLLNSKKQKIRELQEALDKKAIKSIYDETTDESGGSDAEDQNVQETSIKSSNIKKRKANYQDGQDKPKISKKDFTRCTNLSFNKSPSPEPSTSKDKSILQNADVKHMTKITNQRLNILEEEPEDDLFS
ncbi:DNA repair protein XRCC4-like [Odontomachus brunneus]|uniref:DNA repair protein XRCC4-like n=1 Tax=Odontomachus brunneus TaxID=486640 RepID=UPI0013F28FF2|nr:DNA repair protein XRCC4-like [Odontomachus brunneus]